ncbi:Glycerol-3-phosphate acyltransferase 3 [Hypsibius exemplaris]|uniref:Glycerol-3-phosphate acyltransferase 3 n=2 Tax=Hypsibius exemplaris TaxID=2072580 RepID=A0A1W0W9E0_HYPEX|nr:Glycerol-3-phosphate acyltransferase 3 [Hypsibius exemplaris]
MIALDNWLIALASIALSPFLLVVLLIMVLASTGCSLGIREKYVQVLLAIFEWGRIRIEKSETESGRNSVDGDLEREDGGEGDFPLTPNSSSANLLARQMEAHSHYDSAVDGSGRKSIRSGFTLSDAYDYCKWGMEAITEDQVTKSFEAEEINSWNLLTRTNMNYHYISVRLTIVWCLGFLFRYFILMPFRLLITVIGVLWLTTCMAFTGYLPNGPLKRRVNQYVNLMCFRIVSRGFSAIIRFHDPQNKAKEGGICVANHTTPIDVIILSVDNCYNLIGQRHHGFLGFLQRALSRAANHIWFERSETKDRMAVSQRLKDHVTVPHNLPVLVFPEGTCINNTTVMMFKKGCFEVDCPIYPVAIKYDPRFGDAFWNSSEQSMVQYLLMMMTSWAIVCDVWYLPPMRRKEGEDAAMFAARVKNEIANKGGLVELDWDGQLKRQNVKVEWKQIQQKIFSERIKFE